MANTEAIYPGATHLLDPNYGRFAGYRVPAGNLGATTSVQTANQLKEVNNLLNQGIKNTEISMIQMDTFEMIPKDQFKEIHRLGKLTGTESTLHSPIIEPSGFTERGGWNEENRRFAEQQVKEVVERGHELSPDGNVPVTIHSSAIPGTEYTPTKEGEQMQKMIAVNKLSGELMPLIREERFYPHMKEKKMYEPEKEIEIANASYWDNKLSEVLFNKDKGQEILDKFYPIIADKIGKEVLTLTQNQKIALQNVNNAKIYLDNTYQSLMGIFNQAYKVANDDGKKILTNISKEFRQKFANQKENKGKDFHNDVSMLAEGTQFLIDNLRGATDEAHIATRIYNEALSSGIQMTEKEAIEQAEKIAPKLYAPVEEFALENASKTFSNAALHAYKKFGDHAPIISIENPPYGSALSTADDLRKLVQKTRRQFRDKLVSEGVSEQKAMETAEKLIGVTWDTSHLNMIRKQGYGKEKIISETRKIAPFIKHVHLNDNFGSTHTDLPPGMGNIPMKEVLAEIEKKAPGVKKIFEGGNFFQHFQTSPHPFVLEGLGSPIYDTGGGPYWNQMVPDNPYFSGHGPVNPPIHHNVYGAGFTTLPMELGGEIPGQTASRFSGTPMH